MFCSFSWSFQSKPSQTKHKSKRLLRHLIDEKNKKEQGQRSRSEAEAQEIDEELLEGEEDFDLDWDSEEENADGKEFSSIYLEPR